MSLKPQTQDPNTAKVNIVFSGDPSTGIFPYGYEMTIPRLALTEYPEDREETRKLIQELYFQLDQEQRPMVIFDDEKLD